MARRPQEHSIYKIAEETGVSIATVSRVLHKRPGVSEEARRKVESVIERLRFAPNYPQPDFKNIALVIPDEAAKKGGNDYISRMICHVSQASQDLGMNTCLVFAKIGERGTLLEKLRRQQASGALFVLPGLLKSQVEELKGSGVPLIAMDGRLNLDFAGHVDNNAGNGVEEAVAYLEGLGHKRIAFLYNRPELSNHADRRDRYAASMLSRGLETKIETFAPEGQYGSVKDALLRAIAGEKGATAVMTVNDDTALKVLRSCRELGLSVPEKLSVIGFDNANDSEHYCPPLTTIEHPIERISKEAVAQIARLSEPGLDRTLPKIEFKTSLVVRESCAKPSAKASRIRSRN